MPGMAHFLTDRQRKAHSERTTFVQIERNQKDQD